METGILHFHSIWRYVALLLLILTFTKSLQGWLSKAEFTKTDIKLGLFSMISLHIQLLTGFILYYLSDFVQLSSMGEAMKNPLLRFWTVEHITLMIIATILITIGRKKAVNSIDNISKHRKTVIVFGVGLLLIILAIPWPWSSISRPFFNF